MTHPTPTPRETDTERLAERRTRDMPQMPELKWQAPPPAHVVKKAQPQPQPPQPQRKKAKKQREPLLEPVKLAAGAGGAIASTLAGSVFGDTGTIIGVAAGSVISGGIAAIIERGGTHALGHAGMYASAGKSRIKRTGAKLKNADPRAGVIVMSVTATAMLGGIALAEHYTGETVHGLVTHSADYGSTLGGHSTVPPAPQPHYYQQSPATSPSSSTTPVYSPTAATSPSSLPATPSASYTISPVNTATAPPAASISPADQPTMSPTGDAPSTSPSASFSADPSQEPTLPPTAPPTPPPTPPASVPPTTNPASGSGPGAASAPGSGAAS